MIKIEFILNGKKQRITTDPLRTVLEVLREDFALTGTKKGCGEGECGACSILLNSLPVTSCTLNIIHADKKEIKTVEAISEEPLGKLIMKAFYDSNAVQCGFCFPGFMITTYHYIKTDGREEIEAIKRAISGNICRCTGYQKIVESILDITKKYKNR